MILSVKYIDNDLCAPNPWDANCNFDKPTKLAAAVTLILVVNSFQKMRNKAASYFFPFYSLSES